MAFMDLETRKIINQPLEWIKALGIELTDERV